jgi:hypothetical protein
MHHHRQSRHQTTHLAQQTGSVKIFLSLRKKTVISSVNYIDSVGILESIPTIEVIYFLINPINSVTCKFQTAAQYLGRDFLVPSCD